MESSRSRAQKWPYPRYANYESELRNGAAAWFHSKGFKTHSKIPYLLASWEDWDKNMILPEVAEYITLEQERRQKNRLGFPLHKYIHHGLSSQAMLFNLIGPLIVRQDLLPLQDVLEKKGIPWPDSNILANFEYENRQVFNEDGGQPTSIDLVIQDGAGKPNIFIEAKLVEREFGGCSVFAQGNCDGRNPSGNLSCCYLHFIGRKYWSLLEKYSFLDGALGKEAACLLSIHYQFFRELLFAIEMGGLFVLLYDSRNPTFVSEGPWGERGLLPFLLTFVPDSLKGRVKAITLQEVVESIDKSGRHEWVGEFERRYSIAP